MQESDVMTSSTSSGGGSLALFSKRRLSTIINVDSKSKDIDITDEALESARSIVSQFPEPFNHTPQKQNIVGAVVSNLSGFWRKPNSNNNNNSK